MSCIFSKMLLEGKTVITLSFVDSRLLNVGEKLSTVCGSNGTGVVGGEYLLGDQLNGCFLAAVRTNSHQVAYVSSPDYSEQIGSLS